MKTSPAGIAVLLCLLAAPAMANEWILNNFAGLPVTTGAVVGNRTVVYPSLVKDSTCTGGYYCYSVFDKDYDTGLPAVPSADQRIAFVNVTAKDQVVDGQYGAGILTNGSGDGWIPRLDTFMSKVTVAPKWPAWRDYQNTNMDGITFDGGWEHGHVYMEDVTVSGWADAALDVKPGSLQAVRLKTDGNGWNTLKLWWPGPHYIVDSAINNSRWAAAGPNGSDGGLIWSWDCSKLKINVFNSTFNGSRTIPPDRITCEVPGTPTITYLTADPRPNMHPMFATAGTLPPPPLPTTTPISLLTPWYWQLDGTVKTDKPAPVYDIDMENSSVQLIQSLKAAGKVVVCYFSAGTWENWRSDAAQFPAAVKGSNVEGWAGEKWLDIRSPVVRDIMATRMDRAKAKGCDALEPDNVDGYQNRPGFPLTASNQINYNMFLADAAHQRGMTIALKNATDLVQNLVGYFDFAIVEECFRYNECAAYSPFVQQGKAVLAAEYTAYSAAKCTKARTLKFSLAFFNLDLNGRKYQPCPA